MTQIAMELGDNEKRMIAVVTRMRMHLQPFERMLVCESMLYAAARVLTGEQLEMMIEVGRDKFRSLLAKKQEVTL